MKKFKTTGILLLLLVPVLGSISCSTEDRNKEFCYTTQDLPRSTARVSIEQGIWGDIWFWKGDFMPGVNSGEICSVQRTVYIYEPTTSQDVDRIGYSAFYSNIETNLVATTQSDSRGFFQVFLEPGTYSIFIREGDHYYSNHNGPGDLIFPVTVTEGEVAEVVFNITYDAAF